MDWVDKIEERLNKPGSGMHGEIAARTALQVVDPIRDKLTRQIWKAVERHHKELTGDLLDVGCYGGWLYPKVRGQARYTGIDIWPEAVTVARALWGPHFHVRDLFDETSKYEVVWCTQIINVEVEEVWDKLKSLATRLVVYASPDIKWRLPDATETYDSDVNTVAIWRA